MNKIFTAILLLSISLSWVSCEKGVQINDDYQNITIVYGLIDPLDSLSYVRIEKAFLTDGDIFQAAQVPDSNSYPYKLDVKMTSETTGHIINFDTLTVFNKDDGIFYAPKMMVYSAVTKNLLNTEDTYDLEIHNPKTGEIITSKSKLIDGSGIRFKNNYPNNSAWFHKDKSVKFNPITDARIYQLNIRFHYTEGLVNNGDTTFSSHYVDWVFPSVYRSQNQEGNEIEVKIIGDEFYANLVNNIPYKENVFRYDGPVDFIVSVADNTFNTYMEINKPSSSLVIDRPEYTNIENGYGLFASRSKGGGTYPLHDLSVIKLRSYESLNFVQRAH